MAVNLFPTQYDLPEEAARAEQPQLQVAPSEEIVKRWIERDVATWKEQKDRMIEDQDLYEGESADAKVAYLNRNNRVTEKAVLPDLSTRVDKIVSMIAGSKYTLSVMERSEATKSHAQRMENYITQLWDEFSDDYVEGLRQALLREEAFYAALRGMIVRRVNYNPTGQVPFVQSLADPLFVYPTTSDHGIMRARAHCGRISRRTPASYQRTRQAHPCAKLLG